MEYVTNERGERIRVLLEIEEYERAYYERARSLQR